ncbi:MAG: DUF5711 family protein, partial [Lachnospiraceae bacterium]
YSYIFKDNEPDQAAAAAGSAGDDDTGTGSPVSSGEGLIDPADPAAESSQVSYGDSSREAEWESLKAGQDYDSASQQPDAQEETGQDSRETSEDSGKSSLGKGRRDQKDKQKKHKKGLFGRKKNAQEEPALEEDRILGADNTSRTARREYWRRHMMDGTDPDTLPKRMKRAWDAHYKKIMITAVLLILAIIGAFLFNRFRTYNSYDIRWQIASSSEGISDYITFGDVILNYSEDGISCINSDGSVLWNEAFNMDSPTVAVKGDYAIVYDLQGTDFYICTADRCTGSASSSRTILNADISAAGVAALVLDDTSSIYIDYYDKSGNKLEIEVKASISGENGYPIDIAVSPGGTQLLGSFAYQNGAEIYNQVVFRNFDAGKNNANRVVAAFRDYELDMVPEVIFFDDEWSAALRSDGIDFYSTANELKPERKTRVDIGKKIKTVFYSEEYVGIVLDPSKDAESGGKEDASAETEAAQAGVQEETAARTGQEIRYEMIIYDKKGNQHSTAEIDFEYTNVELSGDGIVVFSDSACAVYNLNGVRKFESVLDIGGKANAIKGALRLNEKNLVIYGSGALVSIN